MEDWIHFPQATIAVEPRPTDENAIAIRNWLWLIAALVVAMVIVGGATRLTESGLSIVEWKPVTGVIPPIGDAQWTQAFEDYKQIPQFKELNPDMDLAGFKYIYAWEWAHRLLGRLIGVAFFFPLAFFWLKGRIPQGLKPKLLGIFALGAFQGGVGWWMVASGLTKRIEVAQERLAIHLIVAAFIISACLWVAGGLGPRKPSTILAGRARLRFFSKALLGLVFLQLFVGGLVAGLRAGLVNNTWPMIDGYFIPPSDVLWSMAPAWTNLVDNPLTVQFFHRMIAYVVLAVALFNMFDAIANTAGRARRGGVIVFGHVLMQVALGVATLVFVEHTLDLGFVKFEWALSGTPHLALSLAHQAIGIAVLAVTTIQARRLSDC